MKVLIHEWVTGGGLAGHPLPAGWATEGRAMRRALAEDFAGVPGVTVVATRDARFAGEPEPWETAEVFPEAEEATLLALASVCDCTLIVAPETGGILHDRTLLVASHGVNIGSCPGAIALTADKLTLAAHLGRFGVRTPPSRAFRTADGPPVDHPYPAVVKPIDGAGSEQTFVIGGAAEFLAGPELPAMLLIQPFVPGDAWSASYLVDPEGSSRLLGLGRQVFAREGNRLRYDGGLLLPGPEFDPQEAARAVGAVPGLAGFVGVDFIRDAVTGLVNVIEINPRPTTSFVALRRLWGPGAIARLWLDAAAGRSVSGSEPRAWSRPLRFWPDGTIGHE